MREYVLPSVRRLNVQYAILQVGYWAMVAAFGGYQTALLLERGFSSGLVGFFTSLRCLSGIISLPLLSGWADRHPQIPLKWILDVTLLIAFGANLFFYRTSPGFFGTALVFVILGALELSSYPLVDSMAVQFINAGLPIQYSLGRGLGSFSYAVVCIVLGRYADRFGIESVLLVHGALILLLILLIAAYPTFPYRTGQTRTAEKPHSSWYLLRSNRSFTLMLAAAFFGMMAVLPIVNFLVNIVADRGGTTADLGIALFLMAASELPAAFLYQALWRKLGSTRLLVWSIGFLALKPLLILLAPSLFWVLAVQPIQMLGYGLFTPSSVYFTNGKVPVADRIRGQSLMMVASNGLGGVVGNLLGGFLIDAGGVNALLLTCVAFGAVGVATALAAGRLDRKTAL